MIKYLSSKEDVGSNLSREIKLAIQGLEIFKCLTSHELLVQPDFMVSSRPWQKMFAYALCKCVYVGMELG